MNRDDVSVSLVFPIMKTMALGGYDWDSIFRTSRKRPKSS